MSHHSSGFESARQKTWKGSAAAVRKALADADGPLSSEEIAEATGLSVDQVISAAAQMATISGGVMQSPDEPGKWELFRPTSVRREASAKFAGPITIGRGLKW